MMIALLGVLFHWLGGLASGSFYVPFRKVKSWSWETYWLVGGLASWLIAPWCFAILLTSGPVDVIKQVAAPDLLKTYVCGICWGVGGLTFGLSMRYLGMSLGMAIALGYCAAFGTLIPPIVDGTFIHEVWSPIHGKVILSGILICLVGIAIAGKAGIEKEKGLSEKEKKATVREFDFPKGVVIASFSGIMSAFFAFGFTAGTPIHDVAIAQGTKVHWAGLPVLIVILAGGFTTNILWCLFLHAKNKSFGEYTSTISLHPDDMGERAPLLSNYSFSLLAGFVWYLQFFFYQIGESKMGDFKFSSWTLHMASIIIFSSLWGLKLGEWKGSSARSMKLLYLALFTLVLSTLIIGIGNWVGTIR